MHRIPPILPQDSLPVLHVFLHTASTRLLLFTAQDYFNVAVLQLRVINDLINLVATWELGQSRIIVYDVTVDAGLFALPMRQSRLACTPALCGNSTKALHTIPLLINYTLHWYVLHSQW